MIPPDFYELINWKCIYHGFPLIPVCSKLFYSSDNLITMPNACVINYMSLLAVNYDIMLVLFLFVIIYYFLLLTSFFEKERKMYIPKWIKNSLHENMVRIGKTLDLHNTSEARIILLITWWRQWWRTYWITLN